MEREAPEQTAARAEGAEGATYVQTLRRFSAYPDPREDLKSRSPNLGPYTTKGTL